MLARSSSIHGYVRRVVSQKWWCASMTCIRAMRTHCVRSSCMLLRPLGRAGLRVGPLAFGGAPLGNLGREVSEENARGALAAAWESGVRYFDTAPHYGLGLSERRFGAELAG